MSLEHICQRAVDTALASESAFEAAERMHQRTVGALVVVDRSNAPIGVVTDRDLTVRVMAAGRDASTTALRDVMTAPAETIEETAPIETALAVMRSGAFRRLPIVNQQGKLAGIVTLDDILLALAEQLKQIGQLVEQETPQAAAESAAQKP